MQLHKHKTQNFINLANYYSTATVNCIQFQTKCIRSQNETKVIDRHSPASDDKSCSALASLYQMATAFLAVH